MLRAKNKVSPMGKLTFDDIKEINRLRSLFPDEVAVHARRSEDGGFLAEISTFPGLRTEADTFSELIEMVNDAVLTYFEVPEKYAPFLLNYVPPLEEAQKFGIFPIVQTENNFKMKLAVPAT